MRGSIRDFPHYLQATTGLIMGVEFTAQRKGVTRWAGPEAGLEMGMRFTPPVYTRKRCVPQFSEGVWPGAWQGLEGAGAQNALGLLQSAPEATLCVCVCVCVCARARVLGSHGFWSSLKRLRPCWPGKQGACSRAATHFFPLLGLRKWRVSGMWTPLPSYSRCSKCSLLPPTLLSSAVLTRNDHLLRRTSNLPSPASKT